jgi:hypothetical protein
VIERCREVSSPGWRKEYILMQKYQNIACCPRHAGIVGGARRPVPLLNDHPAGVG